MPADSTRTGTAQVSWPVKSGDNYRAWKATRSRLKGRTRTAYMNHKPRAKRKVSR